MYLPRIADYVFMFKLSPKKLDRLLSMGYFRNANIMFQSQVICIEGVLDDVYNVRLDLTEHSFSKSIRKIARKNEPRFQYIIRKVVLDEDKERLFAAHKSRFKGILYKSLEQLLFGDSPIRLFDTYEISIYDEGRLVAFSFFDVGKDSIASILGVFDAEYSAYSLGIYTMYLEVCWAKERECQYYYPGYILRHNKLFDYKLRVGNFEFFNWNTSNWEKKEDILSFTTLGEKLSIELSYLQKLLDNVGIKNQLKIYPYFSLGYISDSNFQFYVKSPIHIYLPNISTDQKKIFLEYDIIDKKFVLATVRENEVYQQYFLDQLPKTKPKLEIEWECVFEYISLQKFNYSENLVVELFKTYNKPV
jgi:arginyl-tRNA--protein-N-Asp/Glu arginylyltransferase